MSIKYIANIGNNPVSSLKIPILEYNYEQLNYNVAKKFKAYLRKNNINYTYPEFVGDILNSGDKHIDFFDKILNLDLLYNEGEKHTKKIMFEIVVGEDGKFYGKEIITGCIFPIVCSYDLTVSDVKYSKNGYRETVYAELFPKISLDAYAKVSAGIMKYRVADYNEIEEYKKNFTTDDENEIRYIFKSNVFNHEFKECESHIDLSEELKLISEIEYYLSILDKENKKLAIERKQYYKSILKQYNNKECCLYLGIDSLRLFRDRLIFDTLFGKFNNVENLKEELLNKNVDLNNCIEIDYYFGIFLKFQNELPLYDRASIIKEFSKLYFYAIKNNQEDINMYENSYVKEILKNIIAVSNELKSDGLISDSINLEEKDINVSNLVNEINRINLKSPELILK